jgi:HEPN domain-containing protein
MSVNPAQPWLDKASEDLIVARLVLAEQHFAHACFLSEQCIEKSFKAFLIARTNNHPRTHKLVDLLNDCQIHDPGLGIFLPDCIVVDQYYVPTRYPDALPGTTATGTPSRIEAEEAIAAAEKILAAIRQRI